MSAHVGSGEARDQDEMRRLRIAERERMHERERRKLLRPFGGAPINPARAWTWDAQAGVWRDLDGNVCEGTAIGDDSCGRG